VGNTGRPPSEWQGGGTLTVVLLETQRKLKDFGFTNGTRLFLSLAVGAGGGRQNLMRVDPDVNRLKYDRELVRLNEQRQETRPSAVIFLLSSTSFPYIDLIFVPRHRLRAVHPHQVSKGGFFLPAGTRAAIELPGLSASAFKAHFDLSNYDLDAPGLEFRDPWTDATVAI